MPWWKFKLTAEPVPATWICSWCGHSNTRLNAGLDHCDKCNAETMTWFIGAGDLRVRYSRNPKHHHKHGQR